MQAHQGTRNRQGCGPRASQSLLTRRTQSFWDAMSLRWLHLHHQPLHHAYRMATIRLLLLNNQPALKRFMFDSDERFAKAKRKKYIERVRQRVFAANACLHIMVFVCLVAFAVKQSIGRELHATQQISFALWALYMSVATSLTIYSDELQVHSMVGCVLPFFAFWCLERMQLVFVSCCTVLHFIVMLWSSLMLLLGQTAMWKIVVIMQSNNAKKQGMRKRGWNIICVEMVAWTFCSFCVAFDRHIHGFLGYSRLIAFVAFGLVFLSNAAMLLFSMRTASQNSNIMINFGRVSSGDLQKLNVIFNVKTVHRWAMTFFFLQTISSSLMAAGIFLNDTFARDATYIVSVALAGQVHHLTTLTLTLSLILALVLALI
jgi:hypothetical protein